MIELELRFNLSLLINSLFLSAGALLFGCTVALCFLIRDLMFYVIGKSCSASFTSVRLVVSQACAHWQQARPARAESSRGGSKRSLMPLALSLLLPPLAAAGGITVSIIAFVFTIKFLCELAARVVSFLQNEDPGRRGDRSIYDYVRGNYLDPRSCKVSWDWKEPQEVGQTMSFRVQVRVDNFCRPLQNSCCGENQAVRSSLLLPLISPLAAVLQERAAFPCPPACGTEGQHHPHRAGAGHPRHAGGPAGARVQRGQSGLHRAQGGPLRGGCEAGRPQRGLQPLLQDFPARYEFDLNLFHIQLELCE